MIVAADRKQARVVIRFVRGLLAAPVLAKRVVNDVSDAIELEGDVVIEVITASHAVRGYALGAALVDELAFFPSDDASISGAEIIAAIRPAMLTIPGSCWSAPPALIRAGVRCGTPSGGITARTTLRFWSGVRRRW